MMNNQIEEDRITNRLWIEQVSELGKRFDCETREVLYFIQARSEDDGGCRKLAQELIYQFEDRIAPQQVLAAESQGLDLSYDEYDQACMILNYYPYGDVRPAHWKHPGLCFTDGYDSHRADAEYLRTMHAAAEEEAKKPGGRVKALRRAAMDIALRELPKVLFELGKSGPGSMRSRHYGAQPSALDWFPQLWETLLEYSSKLNISESGIAETSILKRVWNGLDDACRQGGMAIIHGPSRIGKTISARRWVQGNLSKARYVSLEADSGNLAFYQEIARGLGCEYASASTIDRVKQSISDVLRANGIMLVIDEAHLLLGSGRKPNLKRIEWLRTSVVNQDIPVVLLTTPQFTDRLNQAGHESGFNIDQFKGRVSNFVCLPSSPKNDDFERVAQVLAPHASKEAKSNLAALGMLSPYYFQAMYRAVREARRLADSSQNWEANLDAAISRTMAQDQTFDESFGDAKPRKKKAAPKSPPSHAKYDISEALESRFNAPQDQLKPSVNPSDRNRSPAIESYALG